MKSSPDSSRSTLQISESPKTCTTRDIDTPNHNIKPEIAEATSTKPECYPKGMYYEFLTPFLRYWRPATAFIVGRGVVEVSVYNSRMYINIDDKNRIELKGDDEAFFDRTTLDNFKETIGRLVDDPNSLLSKWEGDQLIKGFEATLTDNPLLSAPETVRKDIQTASQLAIGPFEEPERNPMPLELESTPPPKHELADIEIPKDRDSGKELRASVSSTYGKKPDNE